MRSAGIIASITVTDPGPYEQAIQTHGAQVCVRGGKVQVQVLGGAGDPGRTVVLKFPSVAAAQAFHDRPEYRKARAARKDAAVVRMVCAEGCQEPDLL
ncbi:DUF1330 domain-containing protein [Verminephrobacter eiseniae]|uniref:DUF1330 domain-containing protein n=1 Tax=Verminephrobacter eiseniae TaxID=364317 RepID=UPI0010F1C423|nr:DUF1330 domain-containing protein [Verminephrobacter eiseniae]KAB7566352.1 DUF1330 domain-containing protein [Verminephrobacter sp. Larva24]MCW5232162.1 DUF1330 domain-containing protein [Verminephrobacter eiseniae]MCW5296275.1 DUF1330 domain-containing protein [Verminephrobacter eiseniae]MCW8184111.1 DUF1330 domain-containing protein [Verminephrobacter eiseniae]MCW8222570.1 DUF1330 domain-containing protein [Verminephrobacter eiseniae]